MSKARYAVTALSVSLAGIISIANFEGFADHVMILVPGDMPTGGFGHADKRLPVGQLVTESQAVTWLKEDLEKHRAYLVKCVKVPLSQSEYDALLSFTFNVGGEAFCNSTLLKKLNAGDYEGACEGLKAWVYSGGVKYKGLETRRNIERLMCSDGLYPAVPSSLDRFMSDFEKIVGETKHEHQ